MCHEFDKRMGPMVFHKALNTYASYRYLIWPELLQLERRLDEIREYSGFALWR